MSVSTQAWLEMVLITVIILFVIMNLVILSLIIYSYILDSTGSTEIGFSGNYKYILEVRKSSVINVLFEFHHDKTKELKTKRSTSSKRSFFKKIDAHLSSKSRMKFKKTIRLPTKSSLSKNETRQSRLCSRLRALSLRKEKAGFVIVTLHVAPSALAGGAGTRQPWRRRRGEELRARTTQESWSTTARAPLSPEEHPPHS